MRPRVRWPIALVVAVSCAPHVSPAFTAAKGAGDRAYSSGRYLEAAASYERASGLAQHERPRDRDEALYLAASAYRRAEAWEQARATLQKLGELAPNGERSARAAFDRGDLEIACGNSDGGYELLETALFAYPSHGLARRTLTRLLLHKDAKDGNRETLVWLRSALPKLATTELDEMVRYQFAQRFEVAGDLEGAREVFVTTARLHPYPKGALFDDALWHASLLDEKLGRPREAIDDLREMLEVREPSTMTGSYERPRYSPAQFRIAELYRDALHDDPKARSEFHALYEHHPTSILRDDALWEEAKLAERDHDHQATCALVARLSREFPDSRYTPCRTLLCRETPAGPSGSNPAGACHAYLLSERPRD